MPVAESYVQLAGRLTEAGNLRGAIDALDKAVALQPNHPAAHYNLALACLNAGMLPRAVAGFRRAIEIKPDFAHAYYNMGLALEQLGEHQNAIAAIRRATTLAPKMADAHGHLAHLLHARGNRAEAIQAYKRAASADPRTTAGRLYQARALMAEGRSAEAESCLRHAIALDPTSSLAHWQLANLFDETGRFEEAQALHRRAIELDPAQIPAYHNLLASKKARDADRPMLEQMQRLLDRPELTIQQRMQLLFAIAKAHDDLAEYGLAMRRFDEANRLRQKLAPFRRDQVAGAFDWLIETFTANLFSRHAALGAADARPVMILGMPRSGTTLVEQIISNHPLVGAGGELTFWTKAAAPLVSPHLPEQIAAEASGLIAAYRAELDRVAPKAARVIDKTPLNFLWIGLIHLLFPQARFVHCRRNPVDTCLSIYTTLFGVPTDYASDRGDLVFYYRQYLRLMEHWRAVLPTGAMFEVQYEELIADPEPWTRALVEFCGLDWDPACLHPEANRRTVQTASLWQARQPIYRSSVERWRRYEPWLGELQELLPDQA